MNKPYMFTTGGGVNVTANRAIVSDANGSPTAATTTATEIGHVNGVTSAIQTQIDAKQARSTLTTKGDLYVATASATVVRQAVGSDGQFLKADSTQTNGVAWASPAGANLTVRNATTTDSPTNSDDVIYLSGASFVVTMFACSGNVGKVITLVHQGTNFSQVYTINADGSDTGLGLKMHTNGQALKLMVLTSSSWVVLDSKTATGRIDYTPTFTGFGTVSTEEFTWDRLGDCARIRGSFTPGTATATEARISFPSNMQAAVSTIISPDKAGFYIRRTSGGATGDKGGLVLIEPGVAYFTFSDRVLFSTTSQNWQNKQNGNAIAISGDIWTIETTVQITDWIA